VQCEDKENTGCIGDNFCSKLFAELLGFKGENIF